MQVKNHEAKELEEGAAKIIGLIPYDEDDRQPVVKCEHEDDGHIYGETARNYVLRCHKCGEYYEEKK